MLGLLLHFEKEDTTLEQRYNFTITGFISIDDDNCEETVIQQKDNLTLLEALRLLMDFAVEHPDCHFQDRSCVELETDDAVLSAYIAEEESHDVQRDGD